MIDKVFAAVALVQTVLTTLRAGSRALHILRFGSVGAMDGPLILPPHRVNESAALWELSTAFRHAVMLEARPDMYETEAIDTILVKPTDSYEEDQGGAGTLDVYRMSTFGAIPGLIENQRLDERIEEIILDDDSEEIDGEDAGKETQQAAEAVDPVHVEKYVDQILVGDEGEEVENESNDIDNNESDYADNSLPDVTEVSSKGEEEEVLLELKSDEIQDVALKEGPSTLVQRTKQRFSQIGKLLRKDIVAWWRRFENDVDQMYDEEALDEETASATSFRTKVDIGSELSTPKKVSVYTYTPEIFQDLRRFFGIRESEYLHSILETGPFVSFQSNSKGAARVGGSFFFTKDGAYLIKSIKHDEVVVRSKQTRALAHTLVLSNLSNILIRQAFLRMLPKYLNFMKGNGQRSLLTRICGMYEVELPTENKGKKRRETLVVMNSVFPAEASKFITQRFDLKGSTMGRECSIEELVQKGPNAVLKDLDLAREVALLKSLRQNKGPKGVSYGLHIGPKAKAALLRQLRRDVDLLVKCNLIDYSLLVGIAIDKTEGPSMQDLVIGSFSNGMDYRTQDQMRKDWIASRLLAPLKFVLSPPAFLLKSLAVTLQGAATTPLPYYGSDRSGVEAGTLSHIQGKRHGRKALYYLGLIDFLQPFNWKKQLEWKWKAFWYGEGFSCVPPEEYAERFLRFVENHVT